MDSPNDPVDFDLKKLKSRDFDTAFHGLVEADHSDLLDNLINTPHR